MSERGWREVRGGMKYRLERSSGRNRNVLGACEIQNTEQEKNSGDRGKSECTDNRGETVQREVEDGAEEVRDSEHI